MRDPIKKKLPSMPSKKEVRFTIYHKLSLRYVNSIIKLAIQKTEGKPKLHRLTPKQFKIVIDELGIPEGDEF